MITAHPGQQVVAQNCLAYLFAQQSVALLASQEQWQQVSQDVIMVAHVAVQSLKYQATKTWQRNLTIKNYLKRLCMKIQMDTRQRSLVHSQGPAERYQYNQQNYQTKSAEPAITLQKKSLFQYHGLQSQQKYPGSRHQ